MPFIIERKRPEMMTTKKQTSAIPRLRLSSALAPVDSGLNQPSKLKTIPVTPAKRVTSVNTTKVSQTTRKSSCPDIDRSEEVAILELIPFCEQPVVNFGEVLVNHTQTRSVAVRNHNDYEQHLYTTIFPKLAKGFMMDATEFLIPPKSEIYIAIAWSPKTPIGLRETITFRDINRHPRRLILIGSAVNAKLPPVKRFPSRFTRVPCRPQRSPVKIQYSSNPNQRLLTKLNSSSIRRQSGQIVRRMLLQHDNKMAVIVQSYCRMILAKRQLDELRVRTLMAMRIQNFWRSVIAKRQLEELKLRQLQIINIQAHFRSLIAQRLLKELQLRQSMIIRIQTYCRFIVARRQFDKQRKKVLTVVKIQSHFRMALAKRRLHVLNSLIKVENIINKARLDWQDSSSPAKVERVFHEIGQAQTRLYVCLYGNHMHEQEHSSELNQCSVQANTIVGSGE